MLRKSDLVKSVIQATGLTPWQADETVSACLDHITNALSRGESVRLAGFGSFQVKHRSARPGRDPRTGQTLVIPARFHPVFRAGKYLNEQIVISHSLKSIRE